MLTMALAGLKGLKLANPLKTKMPCRLDLGDRAFYAPKLGRMSLLRVMTETFVGHSAKRLNISARP